MHVGIIFLLVILGSVLFHIFTPWYWTDIASNWGAMDDTITLTFWVGGGVFIAVCLFMIYCVFKFSNACSEFSGSFIKCVTGCLIP